MNSKSVCVVKFDASGKVTFMGSRCKKKDFKKHFAEVRKALEKTSK